MLDPRHKTGRDGETIAAAFLVRKGLELLHRNWRPPRGGVRGEVDLIFQSGADTLCFVEVKTRRDSRFGEPQEAVTLAKQRQISRLANAYLVQNEPGEVTVRFDVVEVWIVPDRKPRVAWIENAFEYRASSGG